MCKWNLMKFAEALAPALPLADSKAALDKYDGLFAGYYEDGMRRFVGGVDSSFPSKSYIRSGLWPVASIAIRRARVSGSGVLRSSPR